MGKIKGFLFAVRHREILMTDLGLREGWGGSQVCIIRVCIPLPLREGRGGSLGLGRVLRAVEGLTPLPLWGGVGGEAFCRWSIVFYYIDIEYRSCFSK